MFQQVGYADMGGEWDKGCGLVTTCILHAVILQSLDGFSAFANGGNGSVRSCFDY